MNEGLKRANRVTALWEGEGIAVGTFYKTKEKLTQVRSDDVALSNAGFTMPETVLDTDGTTLIEATGNDKLQAFRDFLQANAAIFGVYFDPVDRRVEKYPGKYDEETFSRIASDVLGSRLDGIVESMQGQIDKLIEQEVIPFSELSYSMGEPSIVINELYKDESLKYADAVYPVTFTLGEKGIAMDIKVSLVSGQLKKPRELVDGVSMTMTGLKNMLIEGEILPKPVPKKAKVVEEVENIEETAEYVEE